MEHAEHTDFASVEFWDNACLRDPRSALELARSVAADAGMPRDALALAQITIGRSLYEMGAQAEARTAAESALALCDADTAKPVRWSISLGASAILAESGAVQSALAVVAGLRDDAVGVDRGRLAIQTGYLLRAAGRLEDALVELDHAEHHFQGELRQERDLIRLHSTRAIVLLELGRLEEAESGFRLTHDIATAEGWDVMVAFNHVNLAVVHARARRLADSMREFDRARQVLADAGHPMRAVAVAETDRAQVMLHLGLIADAIDGAQAVLSLVESSGNLTALADARLLVSRCHLAAGQYERAITTAQLAQATLSATGRAGIETHAMSVIASARLAMVAGDQADAGSEAIVEAEAVAADLRRLGWHDEADDLLMAMIRMARRLRRADLARDAVEYLRLGAWHGQRATLLRGWYAEAVARAAAGDVDGALHACRTGLDHVDMIVDEAPDLAQRSGARRLGSDLSDLAVGLAIADGDVVGAFGAAEGTRARSLHDEALVTGRHRPLTVAGATRMLDEIRNRLADDVLVVWLIDIDQVWAVVISRHDQRLVNVGPLKPIVHAHQRVQMWLDEASVAPDASSESAERAAVRLDEVLVAPLGLPAGAGVVMVPVGMLHSVAWSAVPTLAARCVVLAPNAQLWLRSDRRAAQPVGSVGLLVGPDLPATTVEIEAFDRLYPAAVRAHGAGATASTLRSLIGSADLVHVAAHGSFRSDRPLMSSVRLADGEARLADVVPADVRSVMVIVSSCEGGANGAADGSEVLGLSSVLLARGAAAVVAPLTVVRDLECAEFVVELHTEMAAGASLAEASSKVRQRWQADHDLSRWAVASSFSSFGSGRVRIGERRSGAVVS